MVDARKAKRSKPKKTHRGSCFVGIVNSRQSNIREKSARSWMGRKIGAAAVHSMKMAESVRWLFNWSEWNPTESEFRRAVACVQLDEKKRLGKFVFRKDARASLVGRLMMRKFVNEHCGIPYEKIAFARDENNKPILCNPITSKFANFNVSHHGKFSVFAGESRNVQLGVDVMALEYSGGKELREFFRIMSRNFTAGEWLEIRGVPERSELEQIAMFCRHWALKESYVKAIGTGLAIGLGTLDFRTKTKLSVNEYVTDSSLWINGVRQNWHFHETLLDQEHCVAVALRCDNDEMTHFACKPFETLDFYDLVVNAVPLYPEDHRYAEKYFARDESPRIARIS